MLLDPLLLFTFINNFYTRLYNIITYLYMHSYVVLQDYLQMTVLLTSKSLVDKELRILSIIIVALRGYSLSQLKTIVN